MATEGTFNPNGYTREQIALALRRGYESEAQFTQLRTLITAQASTIAGIEGDISDLQQMVKQRLMIILVDKIQKKVEQNMMKQEIHILAEEQDS
jgi:hypothetical protein